MDLMRQTDPEKWYDTLLRHYLDTGEEAILEDVAELGRLLAVTERPIEQLCATHGAVLADVLSGNGNGNRVLGLATTCQSSLMVAWRIAAEGFAAEAAGAPGASEDLRPTSYLWFTADGRITLDHGEDGTLAHCLADNREPIIDLTRLVTTLCGEQRADFMTGAVAQRRIISLEFPRPGTNEHYRLLACPLRDGSGILALRDVTAKVIAREAAFQRRRLESLGQLAGGLAHEFNNLLQPILSMAQIGREEHPDEPDLNEAFSVILDCARNAANVVRGILAYVRHPSSGGTAMDLGEAVTEAMTRIRPTLPAAIRLDVRIAPDVGGMVSGNQGELTQILQNMIRNAVDAMAGCGCILIETGPVHVSGSEALRFQMPDGRYRILAVSDDGPGIPPDLLDRVFDPFFTTKDIGKGTGLGLPVVRGIIESWGGRIVARNRPDGGAVFQSLFPELAADPRPRTESFDGMTRRTP